MLARLERYGQQISLIMKTGVQFLDFGLTPDLRRMLPGELVREDRERPTLARLEIDPADDRRFHPAAPGAAVSQPDLVLPMDESAALLDRIWVPVPLLRLNPPQRFSEGPETWARARLVRLGSDEIEPAGHTHRLTLAIDTNIIDDDTGLRYLMPTLADVQSGNGFGLAHRAPDAGCFAALPWVTEWLEEVFDERAGEVLRLHPQDVQAEKAHLAHLGHYLNLLSLCGTGLGNGSGLPVITLRGNRRDDHEPPIPVDMVLDVGNSRTCGILIEEHPNQTNGLSWHYEIELRDLAEPHRAYSEPFESRVELAEPVFGKENCAAKSGRADAFAWATIARVGPEAARLAARRRGTEGATGLSSPKRYLWDEDRQETSWRFSNAFLRSEIEPNATAAPFCDLVDEVGEALFDLPRDRRMPVFMPHYSSGARAGRVHRAVASKLGRHDEAGPAGALRRL